MTPEYQFHLRLAAQALIDVGAGATYTEAAAKARVMAGKGPYRGLEATGARARATGCAEFRRRLAKLDLQAIQSDAALPACAALSTKHFYQGERGVCAKLDAKVLTTSRLLAKASAT